MPTDAPKNEQLQWLEIDDFRAGIVSQASFGLGSLNNRASVPSNQLGSAQPDATFGCIALPNGGLGPLPGPNGSIIGPSNAFLNGVTNFITGMIVYGRVDGGDEILCKIEYLDAGSNRTSNICAIKTDGSWNRTIATFGPDAATKSTILTYAFTAGMTMTNATDPTGILTGTVGVALTTAQARDSAATGATPYLGIYPDPTNPGGNIFPFDYSNKLPTTGTGVVLTHQGRIVILQQNEWLWTGPATPVPVLAGEFEKFYWTDPINTVPGNGNALSLNQNTGTGQIWVPEWLVGTGAWGSISAGELFVVKRNGGGYIVSGDFNTATVTWLGGVTPTFALDQIAAPTPQGLVYLSNNNGCWLWNGGNTSQKLSSQLNDDFFTTTFAPNIGPKCRLAPWGRFILTPNNYLYDIEVGGWWKLDNQAIPYVYYGTSFDGNTLYCMPYAVTSTTSPIIFKYSKSTPFTTYSWKSSPIPVSRNRNVRIREVVVRAQGRGQISVILQGTQPYSGEATNDPEAPVPLNFPLDSGNQPLLYRLTSGVDAQDLTIQLISMGQLGGPAPIIYSVAVGYVEEHLVNAT